VRQRIERIGEAAVFADMFDDACRVDHRREQGSAWIHRRARPVDSKSRTPSSGGTQNFAQ
jgi:hypothetical protein